MKYAPGGDLIQASSRQYRQGGHLGAGPPRADTGEWTKTYTDGAGRSYKTVFAAASGTARAHVQGGAGAAVAGGNDDDRRLDRAAVEHGDARTFHLLVVLAGPAETEGQVINGTTLAETLNLYSSGSPRK